MDKKSADDLDMINQKHLQNIVVKFLYYAKAIDLTMLMALNSLAGFQIKPTIYTAKHITHLSNHCASHTGGVME